MALSPFSTNRQVQVDLPNPVVLQVVDPDHPIYDEPQYVSPKPPFRRLILSSMALCLMIGLIGIAGLVITRNQKDLAIKEKNANNYSTTAIPLSDVNPESVLGLAQIGQLDVNGRMQVNGALVLTPQEQPKDMKAGAIYYDKTANQVIYFNGTDYRTIADNATSVKDINGISGSIVIGNGLALSGNTLSSTIQPAQLPSSLVSSIQGQSGAVTFTAASGIIITGTTIGNNGVTKLGTATGDIVIGSGLDLAGNTLSAQATTIDTNTPTEITVTNLGNGKYIIDKVGAGGAGTVALGPVTPQDDSTANPSISIDKTTSADLISISVNATTRFRVLNSGKIETGFIDYSNVNGRPASTIEKIGTFTGPNLTLGSGLTLTGGQLDVVSPLPGSYVADQLAQSDANINIRSKSATDPTAIFTGSPGASASTNVLQVNRNGVATPLFAVAAAGASVFQPTSNVLNTFAVNNSSGNTILSVDSVHKRVGINNTAPGQSALGDSFAVDVTGSVNISAGSSYYVNGNPICGAFGCLSAPGANGGTGVVNSYIFDIANRKENVTLYSQDDTQATAQIQATPGQVTNGVQLLQFFDSLGNKSLGVDTSGFINYGSGASKTTLSFENPTANVNFVFATSATNKTEFVCTNLNSKCPGGTGLGGSGTIGQLAFFDTISTVAGSALTQTGTGLNTAVTIDGQLTVNDADGLSLGVSGSVAGLATFYTGNANKITLQPNTTALTGNVAIKFPTNGGTLATSATGPIQLDVDTGAISCPSCITTGGGGGGGPGAVTKLNGAQGDVTIANASVSGATITINNAKADAPATGTKGIATFNSTNFTDNGLGLISTIQNINQTATVRFETLTLGHSTGEAGFTPANGTIEFRNSANTNKITLQSSSSATATLTVPAITGTLLAGVTTGSDLGASGGVLTLGTIAATRGGTGFTTYAAGNLLYADATNSLAKLAVGTNGQCLTLSGGLPSWGSCTGGPGFGTTLDSAYQNYAASAAIINLQQNVSRGGIIIKDNAAPVTGSIFAVQPNSGTTYLDVTSSGVAVSTLKVLGSTGGAGVSGFLRIDNTGAVTRSDSVNLSGSDVSSTLPANKGGTGQSSYAIGDLLYASAATTLTARTIGTTGQCLTVQTGLPTWSSCSGNGGPGGPTTLQDVYINSTPAVIDLKVAQGGVLLRQGTIASGTTTLFAVQNAAGTSDYLKVDANGLTTAGAGLTVTGAVNATSVSAASATFTGGSALTLGTISTNNGNIVFRSSAAASALTTLQVSLSKNSTPQTITLPDASGTLCIVGDSNCGGGGGTLYISNQVTTALAQTANFHISGSGRVDTSYMAPLYTATAGAAAGNPVTLAATNAVTTNNYGGAVNINAGSGLGTGGGGSIGLAAGTSFGSSAGGNVSIQGGSNFSTGTGGYVAIYGGNSASGSGGQINLFSGNNANVNINAGVFGSVYIDGGNDGSASPAGNVYLGTSTNTVYSIVDASAGLQVNRASQLLGQVSIGTADTTGTLLVLDTKTSALDPAFPNSGSMYYNSNMNKFRCYEAGLWKDCIASSGSLQGAYSGSTGGTTPEIILDATRTGVDIQDLTGGTIGATQGLFNVRAAGTASTLGASLFTVQGNGRVGINNGSTSTAPVVSYDLSFGQTAGATAARTIGVETQTSTNVGGNGLTISSGAGNGTGLGGQLTLQAGLGGATAGSIGGSVSILAGSTAGINGNGGSVAIQSGDASTGGANGSGGSISLLAGAGSSNGAAGAITIKGGQSFNANTGGNVTILGGNSPLGTGGNVILSGGIQSSSIPGSVVIKPQSGPDSSNFFVLQNAAGTTFASADSTNARLSVGTLGTPTSQLYVSGTLPTASTGSVTAGTAPATSIQVVGRYAYVTYNVGGTTTYIFDVSNPAAPVAYGGFALPNAMSVRVAGKYMYVLYSNNNLAIYDVSNPENPTFVSATTIASFTTAKGMAISGKYAYIVGGGATGKLQIVDITNPSLPTMPMGLAGFATSGNTPIGLTVRGKYAYVSNNTGSTGGGTFQIFDISNPTSPVQKTTGAGVALGGNTNSGYLEGRYLYFPNGSATSAYDIDNPTSPTLYSSTVAIGGSNALQDADVVSGRYLFAGTMANISVANIANPTSASAVGSIATGGVQPNAIAVQGRYLYAMLNNTLTVYDLGGSYIQQFEAGSTELSNLRVTNSANIGGELSVASGLAIGGSTLLNGGLSVNGTTIQNGDFTFMNGANRTLSVAAQTVTNSSGDNLSIAAAAGNGIGAGGLLTLQGGASGSSNGNGGGVSMLGTNGASTGAGGSINITGGNTGSSSSSSGGNVTIAGGQGAGGSTGTGGDVSLTGGAGGALGRGGLITLQGGQSSNSNNAGTVSILGGSAISSGAGGNVVISGGTKNLGTPGSVFLKPQAGNDTTTAVQIQNSTGVAFFNADTSTRTIGIQNNAPSFALHVGSASVASGVTMARFQNAGGTCDITPNVAGGITCTSDIRFKKNISDYSNALAKLTSLRTVSYNLNSEAEGTQLHVGFIAQELETILPDLVLTDMDGFKSVSYAGLTPYLVAALQEQQAQISTLQGSLGLFNGGTINGSLNVTGPVSITQDLAVTGSVFIVGNLTVADINAQNLTVNGHIITAGNAPQIVALPAAGTVATATIDGNDTAGTITVVAGANTVAGDFVDVIFNAPFTKPPKVLLNAGNDKAADLKFYREADTTKFRIKLLQQPSADQTYVLDYFIVQ